MGVAHEVDNHLSVVIGFSEIIQISVSNEQKVISSAGKILSAGERIATLIKQYSQYVRPHSLERDFFNPGDMIPELLLFSRYDLGRGGCIVNPPASYPPGRLHGDRRDIGLAFLALLFNGAEAMAEKGGELSIGASREAGEWVFSISDQGLGIPPGLEEKVFEEGFTTRTESFRTGMGLPVARHIIEGAEGTLRLENASGGGCVATIRLPAAVPGNAVTSKG
ncbi:MAG: hybrid sensor histidine kinase/response regulator [Deltaproteobacteria bacterium]|nr:hybrid sensor histidine kinase/response regulator [Deltaproteobacteria bacterium]